VESRDAWRLWLSQNHEIETEIWVVFYKVHTGKARISYEETVQEALCFGWIDSLIKRIDDESYARKYTPRRSGSVWSATNKRRVRVMIAAGMMTAAGQWFIDEAKESGEWDKKRTRPSMPTDTLPDELLKALAVHPAASKTFHSLVPTHQKQYILWIGTAKRPETRQRRTIEAVERLERGEQLGLK